MKIDQPAAHIDQLLRQTRAHHVQLSAMADAKANMMLTVPAVVITLAIPRLTEPSFRWAAVTLIVFSLLTVVMAAAAAMPGRSVATKPVHRRDSPFFNLLFFGDFGHMSYEEFERAMEEVMNDPNRTYEAQIREIYTLGVYLAQKKYRFVRLAYLAFVSGLLISGAVFVVTGVIGVG